MTVAGTPGPSNVASFGDITTTRRYRPDSPRFVAAPSEKIPPGRQGALAPRDLAEEVESDVVLHQDVAAVFGELGVFHLQQFEPECAALLGDRFVHGGEWNSCTSGGARLDQRGSRYRGLRTSTTRAQNSSKGADRARLAVREGEKLHVEFARHLAQQMVNANRAAVR